MPYLKIVFIAPDRAPSLAASFCRRGSNSLPAGWRTTKARRFTLAATVLGSSLAFIDATVVNVALPAIRSDLDLGLSGQEWVYLSYSLALAALYLPAGAMGDRWAAARSSSTACWGSPSRRRSPELPQTAKCLSRRDFSRASQAPS